ncbi:hypothetical protein [Methylopila turkensis]|uniref:hypothetical protein n=1 Tax=Methylopila turkensis TaxID=1437816 RepID=UPI0022F2DE9F|nr:hypothetical protein [Methylopila turkensis]
MSGRFIRVKEALLREHAERDDPRAPFYAAMLAVDTYEDYDALAGSRPVAVPDRRIGSVTPRDEIRHARRRGWIADD